MIDLKAWGRAVYASVANPPRKIVEPFRPTFETPVWHGLDVSGTLNDRYFATRSTALWLLNRYGGTDVIEVPFLAPGGPFWSKPDQLYIRFRTPGRRNCNINAGWLADYYRAMPEDEFPGLADRYCKQMIRDEMEATDREGDKEEHF